MAKKNTKKVADVVEEPVVDSTEVELNETPDDDGFYAVKEKEVDVTVQEDTILSVETMHGIDFIDDVKEIITQSFDKPANIKVQVKKSVNSLTASEYKTYLRTGILPNQ